MKRILRIGSMALALCLLLSMFVSCGSFNYMKKSLSKYIKIDAEDYIGIPVTLYSDYEVTEEKLEEALRDSLQQVEATQRQDLMKALQQSNAQSANVTETDEDEFF